MKPRICKEPGTPFWVCTSGFDFAFVGVGLTPVDAYRDWENGKRLLANLVRPMGRATDTRNGVLPL